MSRKTKRTRSVKRIPRWKPILWTLFFINVLLGVFLSRATSIRKVRVVGAIQHDQARLIQHLQSLKRVPYFKVDYLRLESLILANNEIESVRFKSNLFGRAFLEVVPKVPVARIYGTTPLFLSTNGGLFGSGSKYVGLPTLMLSEKAQFTNLTFAGPWEYALIADFCKKVSKFLPKTHWDIVLDAKGMISLNSEEYANIKLGSLDLLDEKLQQLEKLAKTQSELLRKSQELNLTSPKNPVYIP